MYRIYRYMNLDRMRFEQAHIFPSHIDFTIGFNFIKDKGRFEKGRPVSWKYYSHDTDELVCEIVFDDWSFLPGVGVPLQRPFKIYFYNEDGSRSVEYVDKTKSFVLRNGELNTMAIEAEGKKRRANVLSQMKGDIIKALTINHVALDGLDAATAQGYAVAEVTSMWAECIADGDIPSYMSGDLVSPTNPGGSPLRDNIEDPAHSTEAWLDYQFYDHTGSPVPSQTIRQFMSQELTDTV